MVREKTKFYNIKINFKGIIRWRWGIVSKFGWKFDENGTWYYENEIR